MANHDNYVIQGNTLDAIASEVKTLVDTSDKMTIEQMTGNIAHANIDIETQTDLIAQIKTALDGKAAGSGSEIIAEIVSLIDQSGALDSTEGTVEDKVEQLIAFTETLNGMPRPNFTGCALEHITLNCKNIKNLNKSFYGCEATKTISLTNTGNVSDWSFCFLASTKIETLETLDMSSASTGITGYWLPNAPNIKFAPQTIKRSTMMHGVTKFSKDSVQSVIDGLDYVTTAQTLTLNGVFENDFERLTEEQRDIITNVKGWTLAFAG